MECLRWWSFISKQDYLSNLFQSTLWFASTEDLDGFQNWTNLEIQSTWSNWFLNHWTTIKSKRSSVDWQWTSIFRSATKQLRPSLKGFSSWKVLNKKMNDPTLLLDSAWSMWTSLLSEPSWNTQCSKPLSITKTCPWKSWWRSQPTLMGRCRKSWIRKVTPS